MKILFLHAHFDDFEFTAAGTFELWRRKLGGAVRRKVVICTDGKAGHHFRRRQETGKLRLEEQQRSATIGEYEFEMLRLPNGEVPREACLLVTTDLLAALWKTIRDFEPDYLFCPPLPADPLAGVHVDHFTIAEAVRKVAYMINVPHAFTPEYPTDETTSVPCKVPVVLNVYDPYTAGQNCYELAVDVDSVFPCITEMSWCHQSQIAEWLPWVGRHNIEPARSLEDWGRVLRARFRRRNHQLGIQCDRMLEYFSVTGWGTVPSLEQLVTDLPGIAREHSALERLGQRLASLESN